MRKTFLAIFFLLQVFGIVYSRFMEERYFCWAPFDQISYYELDVKVNGEILSPIETKRRYKLQGDGRENRSIHNVFSIIRQVEESYGKGDRAEVKVTYSTNGKEKEEWSLSAE